jgi:hypothetical protein
MEKSTLSNYFLVTAAAKMDSVTFPPVALRVAPRLVPTRSVSLSAAVTWIVQLLFQPHLLPLLFQLHLLPPRSFHPPLLLRVIILVLGLVDPPPRGQSFRESLLLLLLPSMASVPRMLKEKK